MFKPEHFEKVEEARQLLLEVSKDVDWYNAEDFRTGWLVALLFNAISSCSDIGEEGEE